MVEQPKQEHNKFKSNLLPDIGLFFFFSVFQLFIAKWVQEIVKINVNDIYARALNEHFLVEIWIDVSAISCNYAYFYCFIRIFILVAVFALNCCYSDLGK